MFCGGMSFTWARALLPSCDGKPKKSALTMATRVSPSAKTSARTSSSPSLRDTACDAPTPPDTGSNGSGVTSRLATPAWNSAAPKANDARQRQRRTTRCLCMTVGSFWPGQFWRRADGESVAHRGAHGTATQLAGNEVSLAVDQHADRITLDAELPRHLRLAPLAQVRVEPRDGVLFAELFGGGGVGVEVHAEHNQFVILAVAVVQFP